MHVVAQDLLAAATRDVCRNEDKMQVAFTACEDVSPNNECARLHHERKQSLDGFFWGVVAHLIHYLPGYVSQP